MSRKIRQYHGLPFFLSCSYFLNCVVIRDYTLNCSVNRLRIWHITITIAKDKSPHTVNLYIVPTVLFLFFPKHLKGILHRIQHRYRAFTGFCFRLRNMKGGCATFTNGIVDQTMIDADNTLFIV